MRVMCCNNCDDKLDSGTDLTRHNQTHLTDGPKDEQWDKRDENSAKLKGKLNTS